jgi:TonB-dependent SusC/RagA subfamily outer membrane receptor
MFLKLMCYSPFGKKRYFKKTFLVMKLTAIFLFAACLQVSAAGYSQKVTLSQTSISLKKIFKEIENQTGYHFFYRDKLLRQAENVSINIKGASVKEVLNECLKEQSLSYTILDKIIVIKAKKIPSFVAPNLTIPAAPQNIIKGNVKDEKGDPLAGVSVIVKGTQKGTSSGTDGSFSIDANVGDVLEFTIVGYQKKSVRIGQSNNLSVVMEIEVSVANEVVVVGYGTQKKVNLTGSISVVNAKDLENRPLTDASQALQGVKGIYINQAGGQPGADDATIRIRGIGTIGGAGKLDPLVLVDGAESSLRDVNPNDIDNISVLKDAASTAIYGSRAANGVILVTTKIGKLNERPAIEYNGYVGIQSPTYLPDPVDSSAVFMEWYNKAQINQGSVPYYSDSLIQLFRDNPTSVLYPVVV